MKVHTVPAIIVLNLTMDEADVLADILDRADTALFPGAEQTARKLYNAYTEARGGAVTEGDL